MTACESLYNRAQPDLSLSPFPPPCPQIMDTDPYFWSQDNGAGAPLHFATTYKQLDMVRARFHSPRGGVGWGRHGAAASAAP